MAMQGFILILIIYAITFLVCFALKFIFERHYLKKKGDAQSSPKIYYITKPKKPREKQSVIPIKSTIVEKEDLVE